MLKKVVLVGRKGDRYAFVRVSILYEQESRINNESTNEIIDCSFVQIERKQCSRSF